MRLTLLTLLMGTGMALFAQQQPRVMTLQECVNLAVENNLNVQRSKLNLETAEVNKKQADFQRFPSLNASGGPGFSWGRSIDPTSNQFITQEIFSVNMNANSGVTLFNAGRIANSIKQNERTVEASEYDVTKSTNDVQLNVVTFYLNVIFNKELLENARFQLESSQNQLERTKKLVAAGSLPRTNELELISQVSTNEVNLITAENNLNLAKLSLKQAMLLPASDRIEVVEPEVEIQEPDLSTSTDDLFLSAESYMPEIKAADYRVMSSEFAYKSAVAQLYPTLNLNAGVSTNYSSAARRFDPSFDGSTYAIGEQLSGNFRQFVSMSLSIPIFNGFQARSSVQRSKITMQQSEINAVEQRNFLRQTIETAFNDVQAASKSYAAAGKQVSSLEETFRSVENQFINGAANATDLQVSQNNLYRAKSDLSRAKFDFIFKKKLLDFYQGKSIF
jgi:outer membrane protein